MKAQEEQNGVREVGHNNKNATAECMTLTDDLLHGEELMARLSGICDCPLNGCDANTLPGHQNFHHRNK